MSGGNTVTSYVEIRSWCEISGIDMNMWEIESMRHLSSCYLSSLHEYSSDDAQRPFVVESSLPLVQKEDALRMRAMMLSKAKV